MYMEVNVICGGDLEIWNEAVGNEPWVEDRGNGVGMWG